MALRPESIQARITKKFYEDVNGALFALFRQKNYALEISVQLDSNQLELLKKSREIAQESQGLQPTYPAMPVPIGAPPLEEIFEIDGKDEDLLIYVASANVQLTVDKSIQGIPEELVKKTIRAVIDPLNKRQDDLRIKFADMGAMIDSTQTPLSLVSSPVNSNSGGTLRIDGLTTQAQTPFLGSPTMAALILVTGLVVITIFWSHRMKMNWAAFMDRISSWPRSFAEITKNLFARTENHSETPVAREQPPIKIELSERPPQPIHLEMKEQPFQNVKVELMERPPQAIRVELSERPPQPIQVTLKESSSRTNQATHTNEGANALELDRLKSRLLQNPQQLAENIRDVLGASRQKQGDLALFLRYLSPVDTREISRHLSVKEIQKLSTVAARSRVQSNPERLYKFMDKIAGSVTQGVLTHEPERRLLDLIQGLAPQEIETLLRELRADESAKLFHRLSDQDKGAMLDKIPPIVRQGILDQLSDPMTLSQPLELSDVARVLAAILVGASRNDLLIHLCEDSQFYMPAKKQKQFLKDIELLLAKNAHSETSPEISF